MHSMISVFALVKWFWDMYNIPLQYLRFSIIVSKLTAICYKFKVPFFFLCSFFHPRFFSSPPPQAPPAGGKPESLLSFCLFLHGPASLLSVSPISLHLLDLSLQHLPVRWLTLRSEASSLAVSLSISALAPGKAPMWKPSLLTPLPSGQYCRQPQTLAPSWTLNQLLPNWLWSVGAIFIFFFNDKQKPFLFLLILCKKDMLKIYLYNWCTIAPTSAI